MDIIIKLLGNVIAMVLTSFISAKIATAGLLGLISAVLASASIYLTGSYLKNNLERLGGNLKEFLQFVSKVLIMTSHAVLLLASFYALILTNQPVNDVSEMKKSIETEVIGKSEI